jgi:lipopolysaccharide/colanic/teichoic acid biosynthesis glycosyltransferase
MSAMKTGIPRVVEAALALVALIFASPLLFPAAILIVLTSRGPAVFRQVRTGRNGRPFVLYKLRTMRSTQGGPQVTAADDARQTRIGRILRKTKLDEMPTLWNVVRGDLSLVGPRPEVPSYVDLENPLWREVLSARPGITDPVTLRLRNEEALLAQVPEDREDYYLQVLLPFKLRGYADYLRKRTCWSDVLVLGRTFSAIVFPGTAPLPSDAEIRRAM